MKPIEIRTITFGIAISAMTARGASGQGASPIVPPEKFDAVCDLTTPSALPYERCALRLDGYGGVWRGTPGTLVGQEHWWEPPRLHTLVAGDSAKRYARLYEARSWYGRDVWLAGEVLLVAGIGTGLSQRCQNPACINESRGHSARVLLVTGLALNWFSIPFDRAAQRAGNLAIWWHNRELGR